MIVIAITPYQKVSGLPNQWGIVIASGSGRKARLPEISRMIISSGMPRKTSM